MLSRSPNPAALSANTDYKRRPLAPAIGKPVRKIPKKRELVVSVAAAEEHCNCGSEPAREGRSRAGSLPQIGLDLQQSIYRDCAVHANRTGRPAGRPPRDAVLLICPPLREAERRFCGVGRPAWMPGEPRWAKDGPWRRAHGAGPERGNLSAAKAVRRGKPFWLLFRRLEKVTRCKSETNIPVRHECRICIQHSS